MVTTTLTTGVRVMSAFAMLSSLPLAFLGTYLVGELWAAIRGSK